MTRITTMALALAGLVAFAFVSVIAWRENPFVLAFLLPGAALGVIRRSKQLTRFVRWMRGSAGIFRIASAHALFVWAPFTAVYVFVFLYRHPSAREFPTIGALMNWFVIAVVMFTISLVTVLVARAVERFWRSPWAVGSVTIPLSSLLLAYPLLIALYVPGDSAFVLLVWLIGSSLFAAYAIVPTQPIA